MLKAIHALKFKELQVETVVENCVTLCKLYNAGLLVGSVHPMQHGAVSVRPAFTLDSYQIISGLQTLKSQIHSQSCTLQVQV